MNKSMSEIAIFSTSVDEPTYLPLVEQLVRRGHDPWIYRADRVASGEDKLQIRVGSNEDEVAVQYNSKNYRLSSVRSAWFRHPDLLDLGLGDKAKQLTLEQEVSAIQESLWQQIPDNAWMNHPEKMKRAQAKLSQLVLAKELGFAIPQTIVSNDWDAINHTLGQDPMIAKMSKGIIYDGNQTKVLYTTLIDREERLALVNNNPFPAIYQAYISKQREWRVTVVGEEVFEAAIYTSEEAKDDWRRHQFTPNVTFKKEPMSGDETSKCVTFLKRLGLVYGAFDFIEDPEGEVTFLECNTNGQFRWLEETLNMPISNAIVDVLISKLNQ
jgi:hypothetical protein